MQRAVKRMSLGGGGGGKALAPPLAEEIMVE